MQKAFHFPSSPEPYIADAAVVSCFDSRFHLAFSKFLKRRGLVNADIVKIAGGAKALASPATPGEREFVLDQIRTSIRLHKTALVILMLHSDCGAYGGLPSFGNDPRVEALRQEAELRAAADCLRQAISNIEIQTYFVDFDSVWQVGETSSIEAAADRTA
jgi:carbonic anhydrase